jgi:hypothetical protein
MKFQLNNFGTIYINLITLLSEYSSFATPLSLKTMTKKSLWRSCEKIKLFHLLDLWRGTARRCEQKTATKVTDMTTKGRKEGATMAAMFPEDRRTDGYWWIHLHLHSLQEMDR